MSGGSAAAGRLDAVPGDEERVGRVAGVQQQSEHGDCREGSDAAAGAGGIGPRVGRRQACAR
jgi:hypothetical protein